jgi:integrase
VKALRNYLRYRNTEVIEDDEIFFLAKNGTSLNVSTVKYIVAKYVKKAGIRKKVSVHTLRHTFGAHKADKHMSNCGFCQVRHSGIAACPIAECPLFVRPCGPHPPGDFTIPAAPAQRC